MVLAPSGGSLQDQGHLKVTSGGGSLRWRFVLRFGFQQIAEVCGSVAVAVEVCVSTAGWVFAK